MSNLPNKITFQNTDLSIIDKNGTPWLASADLAKALGYSPTSTNLLTRGNKAINLISIKANSLIGIEPPLSSGAWYALNAFVGAFFIMGWRWRGLPSVLRLMVIWISGSTRYCQSARLNPVGWLNNQLSGVQS